MSQEKIDNILDILEDIKKDKSSKVKALIDILESIILPLILGWLAYSVNQASLNLAEQQEENNRAYQKTQQEFQQEQFSANIQSKYIELIYQDITSNDPERIKEAVNFLTTMESELASKFANLVINSEKAPQIAKDKAGEIQRSIDILGNLFNYKIGIYFLEGRTDLKQKANTIKSKLTEYGFQDNQIAIYPRNNDFFNRVSPPSDDQIRYEPIVEEEDAQKLQDILQEVYPENSFRKQTIRGTTRNFISLFLKP